ncbi:torsin-1A-interacting protein 2-like isoform X2 [Thalassophryne amazonica]|uniref:torsin-1A-interacting protein 2-like isoform X2 n=1 Tax=Thalassophryne amazonica TaxID=390379 RepID=UPI0014709151|nr:torsin-1A-interacting protein 2-like isoform X2 [Thalassophryne amazonica]
MEEQVTDNQHITAGDGYKQEEAHAVLKQQNLQVTSSANAEAESDEEEDIQQLALQGDGYKQEEPHAVLKQQNLQVTSSANAEAESDEEEDIQQLGLQDDGGNAQIALALETEKETLTSPQETPAEDNIVEQANNVETTGRVTEHETTVDKFTRPIAVGILGGFNNASETTSPNPCDKQGEEADGVKSQHLLFVATEQTVIDDGDARNAFALETENKTVTSSAQETPAEDNIVEQANNVETTGRVNEDNFTMSVAVGILGGNRRLWAGAALILLVAMLVRLLHPMSPRENSDVFQIDIFLTELEKMKTEFPNQRPDLWKRSRIHLQRHLQTVQPTEPVSLILTAGLKGETTLRCLARGLGSAFSSALNASVLHIDGASKAGQDSDQVKLDIDSQLQSAFDGNKPVAVINRFDELPPGSTLIFYRYCDHENAAFKKTFLIFTVLLAGEEEIPPQMCLNAVEEMVDDYLQTRFLSHDHPIAFDRMDINKYGGLWSRISHLILPVAAEAAVEHEGC